MGILNKKIELDLYIQNMDIPDYYKANSLYLYESYKKSSDNILATRIEDIKIGRFYFFHYLDDSNWMKYSPVFTVDYKQLDKKLILYALNFNFIPLEIRSTIFDKYITEQDIENNRTLKVDFMGIYDILLKYGFEYAIVEYNLSQIKIAHSINMEILPKFLYSGHPVNKYDPVKLYSIWKKKLDNRKKRHDELMKLIISDMYDIEAEISEEYQALKGHISRIRKSFEKYGS